MVLATGSSPAVLKDQGASFSEMSFVVILHAYNLTGSCLPTLQFALQEAPPLLALTSWRKGEFPMLSTNDVCQWSLAYARYTPSRCRGLRSATINAVKAATRRSFQLGGLSNEEIADKYNL